MMASTFAATGECMSDPDREPAPDVLIFMRAPGDCSWYVRLQGRTLAGGGADDVEIARLKAERFIEDRRGVGVPDN